MQGCKSTVIAPQLHLEVREQLVDVLRDEVMQLRRQLAPGGAAAHHHERQQAAPLLGGGGGQPRLFDGLAAGGCRVKGGCGWGWKGLW